MSGSLTSGAALERTSVLLPEDWLGGFDFNQAFKKQPKGWPKDPGQSQPGLRVWSQTFVFGTSPSFQLTSELFPFRCLWHVSDSSSPECARHFAALPHRVHGRGQVA